MKQKFSPKICDNPFPKIWENLGFSRDSLARIHFDSRGVTRTSRPVWLFYVPYNLQSSLIVFDSKLAPWSE